MILKDFYQYQSYLLFHFDLNLADDDENLIDFLCSPLQLDRSTNNPVYHSRFQHPPAAVTTIHSKQKGVEKRGGYNLRKSLAWNKAYFTDEGVGVTF
ncbi:hypothetical protein MKW98_026888, partial [Papaver atlanticum]